jgi:3',5'-cyclic AMP phosphodiesterase CpdA
MKKQPSISAIFAALAVSGALLAQTTQGSQYQEKHSHGGKLERKVDPSRFTTSRKSPVQLPVPTEKDVFQFVVFGDRTGGPAEGVRVLAQAVEEVNVFEPDLVMTVGDLIQGYNQTPDWLVQMREYKGIMNQLECPWFPVAGNHDVYWRGPNRPDGEHESNYEMHFGPLWYAFSHKNSWFIVLYSDEGDPQTGRKGIGDAATQKMSAGQYAWLESVLAKAKGAEHVFLFLHHPRWLGGRRYGNDWEKVHKLLVKAGNVSACFAGHIHRMRYDGEKDGIEYFTLATVGGGQRGDDPANGYPSIGDKRRVPLLDRGYIPDAGFLHHYCVVTVREKGISVTNVPVGGAWDTRAITGQLNEDCARLDGQMRPRFDKPIAFAKEQSVMQTLRVTFENPVDRPIELNVTPQSRDSHWRFLPDHQHFKLEPGAKKTVAYRVMRMSSDVDTSFDLPKLSVEVDYLGERVRVPLPAREHDIPCDISSITLPDIARTQQGVFRSEGNGAVRIDSKDIALPDGPFTVETWARASKFNRRQGLVCKTEGSEYGIFTNDGTVHFSVHLNGRYVTAKSDKPVLSTRNWHHIAGVYDGKEVRVYVDGKLIASTPGSGKRTRNDRPLYVGADVNRSNQPTSHFPGEIDEVRISKVARYRGPSFRPERKHQPDSETILLLDLDVGIGPYVRNAAAKKSAHRILGEGSIQVQRAR